MAAVIFLTGYQQLRDALSLIDATEGGKLTAYGYRVMEVYATPLRKTDRIAFTEPESKGGLRVTVLEAAETAKAAGQKDEKRGHYTRISGVRSSAWGVLLTTKGGEFGEPREVIDVDAEDIEEAPRLIKRSDAVLSDFYMLLIIPPYGDRGLLISEIKGRSHLTAQTLRQINFHLQPSGLKLRVTSDTVDANAWNEFLSEDNVNVTSIELVQSNKANDRTHFTTENFKRARLQIDLVDNSEPKRKITKVLKEIAKNPSQRPRLAGIVGVISPFGDDDFDEENIVTVKDGRERKLEVSSGWPKFTYPIETDERLSESEFVDEVLPVAHDSLVLLNVDVAADWRPKIAD
ncbi:hypothetical protein GCM10027445_12050 [Amycolatopsis endophytica]|uniref:Uncharacterized protein n=1 Tax=Amycolatopsis endophytica TaxID=860233 RepID=A0A853B3J4_9PSEU|nr:hypothetical protein [Amycolatopsis endophytica]NYI89341.1 hypothetical protein [Amycolatopsis endophytica]